MPRTSERKLQKDQIDARLLCLTFCLTLQRVSQEVRNRFTESMSTRITFARTKPSICRIPCEGQDADMLHVFTQFRQYLTKEFPRCRVTNDTDAPSASPPASPKSAHDKPASAQPAAVHIPQLEDIAQKLSTYEVKVGELTDRLNQSEQQHLSAKQQLTRTEEQLATALQQLSVATNTMQTQNTMLSAQLKSSENAGAASQPIMLSAQLKSSETAGAASQPIMQFKGSEDPKVSTKVLQRVIYRGRQPIPLRAHIMRKPSKVTAEKEKAKVVEKTIQEATEPQEDKADVTEAPKNNKRGRDASTQENNKRPRNIVDRVIGAMQNLPVPQFMDKILHGL